MLNLTRYNLEWFNRTDTMDNFHQMVAADEGVWVKFDDIKELLNSSHNTASTQLCDDCATNKVAVSVCEPCLLKMIHHGA